MKWRTLYKVIDGEIHLDGDRDGQTERAILVHTFDAAGYDEYKDGQKFGMTVWYSVVIDEDDI